MILKGSLYVVCWTMSPQQRCSLSFVVAASLAFPSGSTVSPAPPIRTHFGCWYWTFPEVLADHLKMVWKLGKPIICDTKGSINSRISGTFIHGRYFWSGEFPLKTSCYFRKPAPHTWLPTCHLPGLEAPAWAPVPPQCALGFQGQTHSRTHQPSEGLSAALG